MSVSMLPTAQAVCDEEEENDEDEEAGHSDDEEEDCRQRIFGSM